MNERNNQQIRETTDIRSNVEGGEIGYCWLTQICTYTSLYMEPRFSRDSRQGEEVHTLYVDENWCECRLFRVIEASPTRKQGARSTAGFNQTKRSGFDLCGLSEYWFAAIRNLLIKFEGVEYLLPEAIVYFFVKIISLQP